MDEPYAGIGLHSWSRETSWATNRPTRPWCGFQFDLTFAGFLLAGFLLASLIYVPAYAQTQSILVRGTVVDTRGIPVANARIRFDYESDRQQRFSGVTQVDGTYEVNLSSIETAVRESPSFSVGSNASTLSPNYPNPFNPSTVIPYTVAAAGPVEISIYNILGHRVTTLVRSDHTPGLYSAIWNGRDDAGGGIAAGVYLFVLRTVDSVQRGKMVPLSRGPGQSVQYRWNPRPGGQRRARQPGGVFIAE